MGRYIDWKDVTNRYGDFATKGGANNNDQPFIAGAEDEIDGWLGSRYTVPFTPVPGQVKDITIDIAYYKAIIRSKDSKSIWDSCERRLKAILEGDMQLTVSGTIVEQAAVALAARTAYVSSVQPIGGMSVENECFFTEPQA